MALNLFASYPLLWTNKLVCFKFCKPMALCINSCQGQTQHIILLVQSIML
jgi:hypothetical protein